MKFIKDRFGSHLTIENVLVLFIIAFTVFSRLYNLDFQSLWFDELYSMDISNPENSYSTILSDIKTDFHPPLYYILLNFVFKILPYNDMVARSLSALIGISGVYLMFFFGKELKDRRTGILMALLTSIFFFHIKYSQEVRMYILLFTFTVLSSILFLQIIKGGKFKSFIYYGIVTTLTLYTHYYGFFILLAQGLCMMHLLYFKQISLDVLKKLSFTYLLIFITYLPWIPRILSTGNRHHFMEIPDVWYFFEYLYDFTGKEPVTTVVVIAIIGIYLYRKLFTKNIDGAEAKNNTGELLIVYSLICIFIVTYGVSLFKPILNKHGTLAGIPFLIGLMFLVLNQYKSRVRNIFLTVLVLSNLVNIFFVNNYYTTNYKENFKQIATMVNKHNNGRVNIVALSQVKDLYNYYFKQLNSSITIMNPNEVHPSMLQTGPSEILVINAPFSNEKMSRIEPLDELGFLILYPDLVASKDSITVFRKQWLTYINSNYNLDTTYIDDHRNISIAFRYIRKSKLPQV